MNERTEGEQTEEDVRLFTIRALLSFAAIAPVFANTIIAVGQDNHLYSVVPTTGAVTDMGALPTPTAGVYGDVAFNALTQTVYLVSFDPNQVLDSVLYSLPLANLSTPGSATIVGDTGVIDLNSLEVAANGTMYAVGSTSLNHLYTINQGTGTATSVGTGSYFSSGDLEFVNGTLYLTSLTPTSDTLFSVNPANGVGTQIGTGIGFSNIYGMAFDDTTNTLYGFTNPGSGGNVISINVGTGAGILVHSYPALFNGATDLDLSAPEPGTIGMSALGVVAILGLMYRRRRALRP